MENISPENCDEQDGGLIPVTDLPAQERGGPTEEYRRIRAEWEARPHPHRSSREEAS